MLITIFLANSNFLCFYDVDACANVYLLRPLCSLSSAELLVVINSNSEHVADIL